MSYRWIDKCLYKKKFLRKPQDLGFIVQPLEHSVPFSGFKGKKFFVASEYDQAERKQVTQLGMLLGGVETKKMYDLHLAFIVLCL